MWVPFNRPYVVGKEFEYISQAIAQGHLSGNGEFTQQCQRWIEERIGTAKALLTHSCTAALEMAAILADIGPGDEVIMPSYTFVSTANAFVLRGGVPVFVDIRADTLNLDESLIEAAITPRTRAIVPVHYAGVGCDMEAILALAEKHNLLVIEDAAQGIMSSYQGRPLGSLGHLAALSFHETKNAIAGEGGALLVNDLRFIERAEIIWEKGTNRAKFFRGQVDKYTWVDIGSSYLPSDINAAFLWAQLEVVEALTIERKRVWQRYHNAFAHLERRGLVRCPIIPADCEHNAHMYYLLLGSLDERTRTLDALHRAGMGAVFHYVPLHSTEPGKRFCRTHGELARTDDLSDRLLRLPLWVGIADDTVDQVVEIVTETLSRPAVVVSTGRGAAARESEGRGRQITKPAV